MNTDIKLKTLTQIKREITNLCQEYDFDFCFKSWEVRERYVALKSYTIGDLSIKRRKGIYSISFKGNHFFYHDAWSIGLLETIIKKMSQDKQLLEYLEKVFQEDISFFSFQQSRAEREKTKEEREKMRLKIINKYSLYSRMTDLKHRGRYLARLDYDLVYSQREIDDLKKKLIEAEERLQEYKNDKETLAI